MTAAGDTLNVVGQAEFSLPLWACPPGWRNGLKAVLMCDYVHAACRRMVSCAWGAGEEAGTAFYNRWVGAMNTDPEAPYRLMGSKKPTVIAWS